VPSTKSLHSYNLSVFYHAKIVLKAERAKEPKKIAFEPDMTREDLVSKIAEPFARFKQFYCGGVVIQPSRVEEVKFNQTEKNSSVVYAMIRARNATLGSVSMVQKWGVASEGQDITREILEEVNSPKALVAAEPPNVAVSRSNRVFVVHGHDHQSVDQTELLLRRFGLTPIILKEAPSGGKTIIEKFEAHSNVSAAIILLTPDDVGGIDAEHLKPRARQNVIWEWGYLVSRLGRPNVICLYKDGVEMPSDLTGIVTIHISNDIKEKTEEIRRELREAGFEIP
jgi:predicted nucleotide-binding protein